MWLRVMGAFICGFVLRWFSEKLGEYIGRNDLMGIIADCLRFEWGRLRAGLARYHGEKHAISAKAGHN